MAEQKLSAGVQELIDRLREEGVAEGRNAARDLVDEAHRQSKEIVDQARAEADEIVQQARQEAEYYRKSAHDALEMAARDTVLDLKGNLARQFARRVAELVGETLRDEEFLRKVILQIAGRHRGMFDQAERLELVLPENIIGLEELRRHPEKVREGSLGQFVLQASGEMLRDGVEIREEGGENGLRIRLVDQNIQVDLTEESITKLMLDHLLPRFRALLEGTIQ